MTIISSISVNPVSSKAHAVSATATCRSEFVKAFSIQILIQATNLNTSSHRAPSPGISSLHQQFQC